MNMTRRWIVNAGLAAFLAGCSSGGGRRDVGGLVEDPGLRPQANAGYDAWVASFRSRAQAQGISQATLNGAFRNAGFLPGVVERDGNQTEFSRSLEDYLAIVASNDKVIEGRSKLQQRAKLFSEIEARYGVPGQTTDAIWGMESNYGARRGDISVVSATSTLAYDGRRGVFFEKQLIAALQILQRGDVAPDNLVGSWAGAMGHTQFIPTTFAAYAVDFEGDGRRGIWSDDPTDALASAAAYLSASGWKRGQIWGLEVILPSGFNTSLAGRGKRKSAAEWGALGVKAARGSIPNHGGAALLLPAGTTGPAFLVFQNFDVILRYNNSVNYGIGVGYLSDRIAGAGPLVTSFPPDSNGMTIDDRRKLQERLTARGFDTGGSDGVIGPKSRDAIRDYQRSVGLSMTGEPSLDLLRRLG
ncbi:lytic murein transglycosylase [Falsihalocynthiibacter sp. BN13B15]|uniref:lytic murein transglycosylase n=1 Tax=Falsihalocynthiibacter sp. BN13B15 TaxID=3240871 RepID=UPI00350F1231